MTGGRWSEKEEKNPFNLFSGPWPPNHLVGKAQSRGDPDMHRNEKVCVQIREKSFQHLQDGCQGVNIWKSQLSARTLFEKEILEQMPVKYRGEEVRTRTPGISYSRMFQKPDSSFPCQKKKKRERGGRKKDIQRSVHRSRLLRVFRGIGRADATRLLESVSNARTKWQ